MEAPVPRPPQPNEPLPFSLELSILLSPIIPSMEAVVLSMDDFHTHSYSCRICHESCRQLETPCSCNGTIKYAHRECIQRWCDEKGNSICEICLQKYESGYTAIPKQPKKLLVVDDVVSIRRSLQVRRREEEAENEEILGIEECTSTADRSATYCKTIALIFTAFLLLRHFLEVLAGAPHYPFSPATIIVLRSCGIIIPMCVIIRTITALQNSIRRHRNIHAALIREEEANDEEQALQR